MTTSFSASIFLALLAALALAFAVGMALGRRFPAVAETAVLLLAPLAVLWSQRDRFQDALVQLLPLDVLVYTEGALITPLVLFTAGAITGAASGGDLRFRRIARAGPLLALFGVVYSMGAARWMLLPRVSDVQWLATSAPAGARQARALPAGQLQSADESCVAAALVTALTAPDVGLRVDEQEMAALAEVRKGAGSTMLRALWAARRALAQSRLEPRLYVCSAEEAISMASRDRPALASLRVGPLRTHMVALLGWTGEGEALLFNPWPETTIGKALPGGAPGLRSLSLQEFQRLYTGRVIALVDRLQRRS